MTLRIRRAAIDDASSLARLHRACFDDNWDEASMRASLDHPATSAFLAEDAAANELQGVILVQIFADESEILTLGTAPATRRSGVAKALLLHAAAEAAENGARTMFLEVAESNDAALALYRGVGFAIVGRRKSYYREGAGPGVDALRLSAELPLSKQPGW